MPTRSFELTQELDSFITSEVENGTFQSTDGMVRAALRVLQRDLAAYHAKPEALEQALDEGEASGIVEGDVFAELRQELGLPVHTAVA